MRAKKEKTEFGSVTSVVPKKKKVVYGDVVQPDMVDTSKKGEGDDQQYDFEPSGADQGKEIPKGMKPSEEKSPMEKLQQIVEAMEQYSKEKEKEEAKKKAEGEQKKDSEENQEEKEQPKKPENNEDDELTKYLTLQLRIRALGEIFGAVRVAEKGQKYYSYVAMQNEVGYTVAGSHEAPGPIILALDTFPWFKSQDEAEAFLELLGEMLIDYGRLAYSLQAQTIATKGIKVIHC